MTTPEQADRLLAVVGAGAPRGRALRHAIALRFVVACLTGVAVHLAAVLLLPWVLVAVVRYVRWERADYRLSRYVATLDRAPGEDLRIASVREDADTSDLRLHGTRPGALPGRTAGVAPRDS